MSSHNRASVPTLSLAAYRLTRLVTEDTITAPLREKVWASHPPATSRIGYLITCPHCTSVWAAVAVSVLDHHFPRAARPVLTALAVAGAVSIYHEIRDRVL